MQRMQPGNFNFNGNDMDNTRSSGPAQHGYAEEYGYGFSMRGMGGGGYSDDQDGGYGSSHPSAHGDFQSPHPEPATLPPGNYGGNDPREYREYSTYEIEQQRHQQPHQQPSPQPLVTATATSAPSSTSPSPGASSSGPPLMYMCPALSAPRGKSNFGSGREIPLINSGVPRFVGGAMMMEQGKIECE